jgi:5'-phosphate synthase pdxT subunit
MLKLLDIERLFEPIKAFGLRKPIFGTCAGAILLASSVSHPVQASFALMDISVERNGYGRQLASRVTQIAPEAEFLRRAGGGNLEAVFIRAPIIRTVAGDVKVLARYRDTPVLVEQGRHMAATFHPELTVDPRVHGLFLAKL